MLQLLCRLLAWGDCHARHQAGARCRISRGWLNVPDPAGWTEQILLYVLWYEGTACRCKERFGQRSQSRHRLPWSGVPQNPPALLGSAINQCANPLPSLFFNLFCHFARNVFSWGFQALMGSLWVLTVYNSNKVKWSLMGEIISLAWGLSVCWILTASCKLQG